LQQAFVTRIRVSHAIGIGEWHPSKTVQQSNFYAAHLRGSKFCYVEAIGPVMVQGTELNMGDFDVSTGPLGQLIFRQKHIGTSLQAPITPLSVPAASGAATTAASPVYGGVKGAQSDIGGDKQVSAPIPHRKSIMDITRDMCR